MPRLIVPSIGGGTNRSGTFRSAAVAVDVGESDGVVEAIAVGEGEGEGEGDSSGVAVGVGDSCANASAALSAIATRNPVSAIRNLNIVTPVDLREKIVAPFTIGEQFFVNLSGDELIV